ncbi:MAG: hypothetical protein WAO71_05280 [Gallionella sp.]
MKNPALVLRIAIILEWLLIAVGLALIAAQVDTLPTELKPYFIGEAPWMPIIDSLSVLALLIIMVSSVGLWLLRSWARLPFAAGTVWLSLATLFEGPGASLGMVKGFEELSLLTGGFIIAWSFFPRVLGVQQA